MAVQFGVTHVTDLCYMCDKHTTLQLLLFGFKKDKKKLCKQLLRTCCLFDKHATLQLFVFVFKEDKKKFCKQLLRTLNTSFNISAIPP